MCGGCNAPLGAERVRKGYLSHAERSCLADLLEAVGHALAIGHLVPGQVALAYGRAERALTTPRGVLR